MVIVCTYFGDPTKDYVLQFFVLDANMEPWSRRSCGSKAGFGVLYRVRAGGVSLYSGTRNLEVFSHVLPRKE